MKPRDCLPDRRPGANDSAGADPLDPAMPTADSTAASFEESLAALETIVRELEHGDLGLADALARYEHGVRHLQQCYRQLERAERRVELLKSIAADGSASTESFDEQAMTLEQKADARSNRRTAQGRRRTDASDAVDGSPGLF
jgi:exodeoxyribonuclease VII small subunit